MVTGNFLNHESGAALRSLLEFESQKHGLPIEFSLADLRQPQLRMFNNAVQVFAHNVGNKLDLMLPFPDGEVNIRAQAYNIKGTYLTAEEVTKDLIGFKGEDFTPIAHIEANRLIIYFNLFDLPTRSEDGTNILAKVCDFIFGQAMPILKETIEKYDFKDERLRYAEVKCMALKAKEKELAQNIATNERELQECLDGVVRYTRSLQTDRLLLEDLKVRTDRKKTEDAVREYLSLLKLTPQPYKEIFFDDKELKAYTPTVYIHHEGTDYEIGEFEVKIAFESGRLSITNLTNPNDGYDHPHINGGTVCLGNISTGIAKMIAESEYVGTLTVLHEYLKSYNKDDAYYDLRHWGDGGWHDYESCIGDSSTYDCLECSDFDCPYHDERYSRCWENASTSECLECGLDCSYREDAQDNCRSDHSARECRVCQQSCSYQGDEDNCYEDTDDGAECIGCDVEACSYRKEEAEDTEDTEDDTEEKDHLTAILQEEA